MTTRVQQLEAQVSLLLPLAEQAMRYRALNITMEDKGNSPTLVAIHADVSDGLDQQIAECISAGLLK